MSRYSDLDKTMCRKRHILIENFSIQESSYPIYDNEIDNEIVLPQEE